jgi:hypothetical protein
VIGCQKVLAIQSIGPQDARRAMRTRFIALGLALVGAASFALSSIEAWWRVGETLIGPFGTHHCFSGDCQSTGLSWIGGGDLWMRSAVATRAAAIIASMLLVIVAGALAARRTPRLVARTTLIAITAAIATGAYFVARFPSLGGESLGAGPGLFLYGAGVATGLSAAVLVLRLQPTRERHDHEDQDDQASGAKASGAPAAVTDTATEQSKNEQDD